MRVRVLAAVAGAAALLVSVPVGAALADPGWPGDTKSSYAKPETKPQGWTLCVTRTGKMRPATKSRPCTRWETAIPVTPAQQKDDKPAPYWLRDGATTKYCAATGKFRGVWVIECKQFGQPKPAPTAPTPSVTAKPAS